jgi:hypothetical protein
MLLLSDSDGAFPIELAADPAALGPVLDRLPRETVLVEQRSAAPSVLAGLHARGIRFATDAPPGRHEVWRRLPGRGHTGSVLWSNDPELEPGALAGTLTTMSGLAAESWQEIATGRPALAVGGSDAFETSFGLAVSLALGSIAWELWRKRETVAPVLALHRFADFGGWVRADHEAVTVRLALGRRFFDLRDAGFLDDVAGVPWFDGRVLRFRSG